MSFWSLKRAVRVLFCHYFITFTLIVRIWDDEYIEGIKCVEIGAKLANTLSYWVHLSGFLRGARPMRLVQRGIKLTWMAVRFSAVSSGTEQSILQVPEVIGIEGTSEKIIFLKWLLAQKKMWDEEFFFWGALTTRWRDIQRLRSGECWQKSFM